MSNDGMSSQLHRLIRSGICTAEDASQYEGQLKKLAEEVASLETAKRKGRFFKALADENRLRILGLLGVREMCVCELIVALGMAQPTASHHLGLLENADLVRSRKEGKWVFYSLARPELLEDMRRLGIL